MSQSLINKTFLRVLWGANLILKLRSRKGHMLFHGVFFRVATKERFSQRIWVEGPKCSPIKILNFLSRFLRSNRRKSACLWCLASKMQKQDSVSCVHPEGGRWVWEPSCLQMPPPVSCGQKGAKRRGVQPVTQPALPSLSLHQPPFIISFYWDGFFGSLIIGILALFAGL